MKNEQNLLEIRDLRVTFRLDKHSTFDAVKGISFDIPTHRIVALVGESGSGKSVSGDVDPGVAPAETRSSASSSIAYGGADLLKGTHQRLQDVPARTFGQSSRSDDVVASGIPWRQSGQCCGSAHGHDPQGGGRARGGLLGDVGIPDPQRRGAQLPHELSGRPEQSRDDAMAIPPHPCEPHVAHRRTTHHASTSPSRSRSSTHRELQEKHHMSVLFITHRPGGVGEIAVHVV